MDNNVTPTEIKIKINDKLLGYIALGIAGLSALLAILGTSLTCACSAKKSIKDTGKYTMSGVVAISIIAVVLGIVAMLCAIMILMKDRKNMIAIVALAVGGFAFVYALLPTLVICCYNCSLKNASEKSVEDQINNMYKSLW